MNELGRHRKNDYWKDETLGMKQYDAVQCRPDHDKPEIGSRLTFICEARAIYRRSIYIDVSTLVRACVLGTVSRFKISQADFLVDSLLDRADRFSEVAGQIRTASKILLQSCRYTPTTSCYFMGATSLYEANDGRCPRGVTYTTPQVFAGGCKSTTWYLVSVHVAPSRISSLQTWRSSLCAHRWCVPDI